MEVCDGKYCDGHPEIVFDETDGENRKEETKNGVIVAIKCPLCRAMNEIDEKDSRIVDKDSEIKKLKELNNQLIEEKNNILDNMPFRSSIFVP